MKCDFCGEWSADTDDCCRECQKWQKAFDPDNENGLVEGSRVEMKFRDGCLCSEYEGWLPAKISRIGIKYFYVMFDLSGACEACFDKSTGKHKPATKIVDKRRVLNEIVCVVRWNGR